MRGVVVEPKCSGDLVDVNNYLMARIMAVAGVVAAILVLSGLFHSVLRRMDQPSVISHILAGIVVGPTVLGHVVDLGPMGVKDAGVALEAALTYLRVLFMFFIGVEVDLRYLRHNLRRSAAVACGGAAVCLFLAVLGGPFFYGLMHPGAFPFPPDKLRDSTELFAVVVTSSASPVLVRIVTELKLMGSDSGQLAIGAAFAKDMASVAALSAIILRTNVFGDALRTPAEKAAALAVMVASVWAITRAAACAARLLNRLERGRRYISTAELCGLLLLVSGLSSVERLVGYSDTMACFLIGLAMPREGPTARTILDRLAYPVHQVLAPICFATIGARLDLGRVGRFAGWRLAEAVAFAALLSAAGNVAGTVLAGRALGSTAREAVVLGLLLNAKGYADILAIRFGDRLEVWGEKTQAVLLLASIVNTFMAGPAAAAIVRQQRGGAQYQPRCLQDLGAGHELCVLACVHGAAGVHSMLALADLSQPQGSTSGGAAPAPPAVHLLHLVELAASSKYTITHHLYRFRDDFGRGGEEEDDDDWSVAHDIEQVAAAVAAFAPEAPVRHTTAVASLVSMDTDVCNAAADARASLVVVPCRKELRYDGRLVCRREGRRHLNQRVLQRAPCTVGVLAERRRLLGGDGAPQQVAALFLGGPDDREAAAFAARLSAHLLASVTVYRFLLPAASSLVVAEDEEAMADEEFMADLHARLVVTGQVGYTERSVRNGADMVDALSSMAGTYDLFVLGRSGGGAWAEEMTRGMGGDWGDEFPELGPVGELLASDDFRGGGSVLALQQHSMHKTRKRKQEEQPPQRSSSPPCQC